MQKQTHRYYYDQYPEKDSIVMTKVTKLDHKNGIIKVVLVEYSNMEAIVTFTEVLKNMKTKKKAIVKIDQEIPMVVLSVDPKKGHILLSKKKVLGNEITIFEIKFKYSTMLYKLAIELWNLYSKYCSDKKIENIEADEFMENTLWDIYEKNENLECKDIYYNILQNYNYLMDQDSSELFSQEFKNLVTENFKLRIIKKNIISTTKISLRVIAGNGIQIIKDILLFDKEYPDYEVKIISASPIYTILIYGIDENQINNIIDDILLLIEQKVLLYSDVCEYKIIEKNVLQKEKYNEVKFLSEGDINKINF